MVFLLLARPTLNRQLRPPESLFRQLVLFVIEKADSPARQSVYPPPFRLLTIIMIHYNDNLYAWDEGLYLMSELIGKGCIIVDGNVRDNID